ncbi:tetratricopeptide repeat protein [Pelagibacterium halotolerans]|nr:tetratricopeptide repeat protein [Pelagibacterium halotolerans]QJR18656.1 sel1 repeat family protein [Pelagibacterium halotolerans]
MPIVRSTAFALAATCSALLSLGTVLPAQAQSALDAAQELAQMLDGVTATELSGDNLVSALEGAADAGQPIALWQLGTMYETGAGVQKDPAKAFQYFSRIANENADAPPSSLDADIVAQSFVKIGDYYMQGVPDAGIPEDASRGQTLLMHAATYFGDADAQFRVGMLYLNAESFGINPLQGARWLSLAARKGHAGAQARLGEMLVVGNGIEAQPIEGLMWLNIAYRSALGTSDEGWIRELTDSAMAKADPAQAEAAVRAADTLGSQFAEF